MSKETAVIIISGGMDSATLLYYYAEQGYDVRAISFDYGQRHSRELKSARELCSELDVEHKIIDLRDINQLMSGSSQTDKSIAVPEGHYEEESMKKTVVPNRNMVMLSTAGSWAVSLKADILAYGAHAGDHAIYPDCRKEFVDVMREAFTLCDWHNLRLEAPFLKFSKGDIAKLGKALQVPYEKTWTCYNPILRRPRSSSSLSVEEIINWRPDTSELSEDWVVGFIEGEGCFSEGYSDKSEGKKYPALSVSQKDSLDLLQKIKKFFGMGSAYAITSDPVPGMGAYELGGAMQLRKFAYWIKPRLRLQKRIRRFNEWTQEHGLLDFDTDAHHCGKCGACQERREAFEFAQMKDPTEYEVENVSR